jgi:hypothetical protein
MIKCSKSMGKGAGCTKIVRENKIKEGTGGRTNAGSHSNTSRAVQNCPWQCFDINLTKMSVGAPGNDGAWSFFGEEQSEHEARLTWPVLRPSGGRHLSIKKGIQ